MKEQSYLYKATEEKNLKIKQREKTSSVMPVGEELLCVYGANHAAIMAQIERGHDPPNDQLRFFNIRFVRK